MTHDSLPEIMVIPSRDSLDTPDGVHQEGSVLVEGEEFGSTEDFTLTFVRDLEEVLDELMQFLSYVICARNLL